MRVKSSGMAPGLANAQSPGSAKFANSPKWPGGGGGWAQVKLTDALKLKH